MKDDIQVKMEKGKLWTTTLDIAEKFGKQHKNVLQAVQKMECSDNFSGLNFQPAEYADNQGKKRPMLKVSRSGFTMLVMGFTGKKAAHWRERYIDAFDAMESHILRQGQAEWIQARATGKLVRRVATDAVKIFVDYATAQGSKNAQFYYSNLTKMTYKALAIIEQGLDLVGKRELMEACQLIHLAALEDIMANALLDGVDQGLPYKEIYVLAKDRAMQVASMLKRKRVAVLDAVKAIEPEQGRFL